MAKGYKLFRYKDGNLYPLYVLANKVTPIGEWLLAEEGEQTESGKVKSRLGELAYRPGWHINPDVPCVTHIGKRDENGNLLQKPDTVWCEVEYNTYIDYGSVINGKGLGYIPANGFYRFKTSPKMRGEWVICGEMKVNRILTQDEVNEICRAHGVEPQKCA